MSAAALGESAPGEGTPVLEPSAEPALAVRIGDGDQAILQAETILVGRNDFKDFNRRCSREQLEITGLLDPPGQVKTVGKKTSWITGPGCSEDEAKPLPPGATSTICIGTRLWCIKDKATGRLCMPVSIVGAPVPVPMTIDTAPLNATMGCNTRATMAASSPFPIATASPFPMAAASPFSMASEHARLFSRPCRPTWITPVACGLGNPQLEQLKQASSTLAPQLEQLKQASSTLAPQLEQLKQA